MRVALMLLAAASLSAGNAFGNAPGSPLDRSAALRASQAVVGQVPGDYVLLDRQGRAVRLSRYRGKPLLVNFIYTGCHQVCPTSTLALHTALRSMRGPFTPDHFRIVTIGFNPPADSPAALQAFAAQQRIDESNWDFLSPRPADVPALARDFGFSYAATPAGFDHLLQVTILDTGGRIRRQVYGDQFNAAALGEPLKQLLTQAPLDRGASLAELLDRVRILCSVYDVATGRYRIDYTLPLEVAGGLTFVVAMAWFALVEWRAGRKRRRASCLPE